MAAADPNTSFIPDLIRNGMTNKEIAKMVSWYRGTWAGYIQTEHGLGGAYLLANLHNIGKYPSLCLNMLTSFGG